MKMLLRLTSVWLLAVMAVAQTSAPAEEPPDLLIVKFNWERRSPIDGTLTASTDVYLGSQERRRRNDGTYESVLTDPNPDPATASTIERARRNDPDNIPPGERKEQYAYRVTLENRAAKNIKAIYWDYVFLDPETEAEADRHQFYHKEKIGAGKKRELQSLVPSPPTRVINVNDIGKKTETKYKEKIIINRIEYTDGSYWQRSSFTVPDDRDR